MNRVAHCCGGVVLVLFSAAFAPHVSRAGQITLADFSPAAVVQDFQVLGNNSNEYATPIVIGSATYTADDGILVSSSKLGPTIGRSGAAIGNEPEKSRAIVGFVDIELGSPVQRAGLYVGFEFSWASDIYFFDGSNHVLGFIALTGSQRQSRFAAWQADDGAIKRVRVVNSANPEYRIIVDDLITEVPEPVGLFWFTIGALLAVLKGRWRSQLPADRYPLICRKREHHDSKALQINHHGTTASL